MNELILKACKLGINYLDIFGENSVALVSEFFEKNKARKASLRLSLKLQTPAHPTYNALLEELNPQLEQLDVQTVEFAFALRGDEPTNIPELCQAYSALVDNQKAKTWGMYGWLSEEIEEAHNYCRVNGLNNLTIVQNEFSLGSIEAEEHTIGLASKLGISALVCLDYNEEYARLAENQILLDLSKENGMDVNQLSLSWIFHQHVDSCAVIAGGVSQIERAFNALENYKSLSQEKQERIKQAFDTISAHD